MNGSWGNVAAGPWGFSFDGVPVWMRPTGP
jgi:hypothetical protein